MENIDIVFHGSIPGGEIKPNSVGVSIPTGEPEKPAAADHRHLSHGGKHRVPTQNTQSTPIILSFRKSEVQNH